VQIALTQIPTLPCRKELADTNNAQMNIIATAISNVCNNLTDLLSWLAKSKDVLHAELFGVVLHIKQLLQHHDKYCKLQQTVL
jgi:hypothetical protein